MALPEQVVVYDTAVQTATSQTTQGAGATAMVQLEPLFKLTV